MNPSQHPESGTPDPELATRNSQPATSSPQRATPNPEPATRNSQLATPVGPELATRNSQLATGPLAVVAEDDEGLNRLICKHLERRGIKLVGVHSGADAIAAIEQHPDCLLLLDYVLLDMNGHQLLDKLNNMGLRVPFIVMTGHGDERVAVEMMKLGARDYLVKQPDFLELVPPVVERVLGQIEVERKLGRAEQDLHESETRFRALFENSGSCVTVYEATDNGADFIIRDFNRAAERTDKVKREEVIGRPVTGVFPGVREFGLLDVFRRVWRTGRAERHPVSMYKDERISGWRENYVYKLPSGEVVAVYEDVTERKLAEQALRAEKERAQLYLDVAGVVLVALDASGRITLMNRSGCRLLGYSENELIGRDWFDTCLPERVRDEVKGVFNWLMVGAVQPVEYYENPVVTRSGEERLIAWHNVALRDESGRAIGTLGSGEDITARRQAEQEAQAEREQLRRILDAMPDGAYVVGQDFEFQYVNPTQRARSGPVNDRKCFDYFYGRAEPCPNCINARVFVGEARRREYTTKQGITYDMQDVPVTGNDGRPARLVFMRDITERKRAEAELTKHRMHLEELVAERTRELTAAQEQLVQHGKLMTLGRVAGSVAHEIRNPLGAIKNASWFLQKNAVDKLEGRPLHHLQLIDESIETANRAITAILDFTWRLQGDPKKCTLRPLLERAVAEATIHATVNVHFDVKPGLPHVLVDDRQMVAVFRNLFTNAAQAMPDGGTIRVSARRKYRTVIVDVADTGSGIKPEHLAKVFEPLFTTKDIGIGLGLAICRDFVEANKGTITVVSEVGKGTTFTVALPTAEEDKLETPNSKL